MGGVTVGSARIDETSITGSGGPYYPRLIVPMNLRLSPYKNGSITKSYILQNVRASLTVSGIPQKIAETHGDISAYKIQSNDCTMGCTLEFVLDTQRIHQIEEIRPGEIALSFGVRFDVFMFSQLKEVPSGKPMADFLDNIQDIYLGFTLTIPQSHWVKAVLGGLGYGKMKVIEVPVSEWEVEQTCADELSHAKDSFVKGDYDQCVGYCRTALDVLKKVLPELTKAMKSDSQCDWVNRIADSTSQWLSTTIIETFRMSSKPHHPPSVGHFSRHEAENILLITCGIVSYCGKLGSTPEK